MNVEGGTSEAGETNGTGEMSKASVTGDATFSLVRPVPRGLADYA